MSEPLTFGIHMGISVRGALKWSKAELRKALLWMKKDGGKPFASVAELRQALEAELAQGHEVIPYGNCDNWDFKDGCQGHGKPKEPCEHVWGIDGAHSNEYCKRCFISRKDSEQREAV